MSVQRFIAEYKKLVLEEIEMEKRSVLNGVVLDYADYKFKLGKLSGLAKLYGCIDEVETAMNKE